MATKRASAVWQGSLKEGKGSISTETGVLKEAPYGFKSRFEEGPGTNPEELVAAAHAGCFSMAFSKLLGEAGLTAERIDTQAAVTLEQKEGGFAVTSSHLTVTAKVPGATGEQFSKLANDAKSGCPISKLLNCDITMDASLA